MRGRLLPITRLPSVFPDRRTLISGGFALHRNLCRDPVGSIILLHAFGIVISRRPPPKAHGDRSKTRRTQ
jgi:hypothetical protein